MKSLKSQNVIHDHNYAEWPEGAIVNETDEVEGTPVVRGVYNDVLVNIYALLKQTGININNLEDSETNGYQIISALKRVYNETVDVYKILQKRPNDLFLQVDLGAVPNGSVFHVRLTESLEQNLTYKLTDNGGLLFDIIPLTLVAGGDYCVLFFDGNQSKILSLNPASINQSNSDSFQVFGNPISQNASISKIWYFNNGILSNMNLEFFDIKNKLIQYSGDSDLETRDVIQIKDKFICLCFKPSDSTFKIYSFNEGNFDNPQSVIFEGLSISSNNLDIDDIYMYADSNLLYFTNQGANSLDNNLIAKYEYNQINNSLKHLIDYNIHVSFVNNSNSVVRNDLIFSLSDLNFKTFRNDGTVLIKETFGALQGQIFKAGVNYYFTDGHSAKKINL